MIPVNAKLNEDVQITSLTFSGGREVKKKKKMGCGRENAEGGLDELVGAT